MVFGVAAALIVAWAHVGLGNDLSDFQPKRASAVALIGEDAQVFARSRWRIKNGHADRALRELDTVQTQLFADRVALLRGQAFEARRDPTSAKSAYQSALELAASPAITDAALRGLVSVTGKLNDYAAQLAHLEALIGRPGVERDFSLELLRIDALSRLGRKGDARGQAWAIIDAYPNTRIAEDAKKALFAVERRGLNREEASRFDFARARSFARAGRYGAAIQLFSKSSAIPAQLEMAAAFRQRGDRPRAQAILERLRARSDLGDARRDVLLGLARIAVDRYQFPRARALFAELEQAYPLAGALEAAELEHDEGDLLEASRRALELADRAPTSPLAPRALWLAGWSAYLAKSSTLAATAFSRLQRHEGAPADLEDAAEYWLARSAEARGKNADALEGYRDLATRTPLRYYGLLARERLHFLGETAPIDLAPPVSSVSSVEAAIALLGPERPLNIDRAVALLRADMRSDGVEELLAATDYFRRTDDRRGMALAIELFALFDRDAWALLLARNIAEDNREISAGDPHFGLIWRYAYPTPFLEDVVRACKDHRIDAFLAYAVMRTESRYRPDAVSPVGARGLMQLMPATARWIGRTVPGAKKEAARYRAPGPNIWLGSAYVRNLIDRYRGNLVQVLGAYNAGPGAVDRWNKKFGALEMDELAERTPYTETRQYIRQTLESFLVYHALYDEPKPSKSNGQL